MLIVSLSSKLNMIIILIIYSLSTSLIPSSKDSVEISISSSDSVITFEKPINIFVTVNNNSKKNKTIREFELPTINNYRIPWKLEIVFQNTDTVITSLNAYIYFSDKVEDEYIELKDKYSFSFTLNYNHIYFMIPDSNKPVKSYFLNAFIPIHSSKLVIFYVSLNI